MFRGSSRWRYRGASALTVWALAGMSSPRVIVRAESARPHTLSLHSEYASQVTPNSAPARVVPGLATQLHLYQDLRSAGDLPIAGSGRPTSWQNAVLRADNMVRPPCNHGRRRAPASVRIWPTCSGVSAVIGRDTLIRLSACRPTRLSRAIFMTGSS